MCMCACTGHRPQAEKRGVEVPAELLTLWRVGLRPHAAARPQGRGVLEDEGPVAELY